MRFLKTLTLNPRALYDDRLAITTLDSVVMNTPKNLLIPKGVESNRPGSPVNGMIRYNTDTNQFEGYQAGSWRQFRFKEATKITLQNLGYIDGYSYFYGPLNALYNPASVANTNDTFDGQSILVMLGNVLQIHNTNYTITQNPVVTKAISAQANNAAGTLTVSSTATIPTGSTVTGSPYLQANTIATVTNATTITLSKTVSGGAILSGTTLTFTAPTGYYLNFTSDPVYSGLGFNTTPINVLLGFDQ